MHADDSARIFALVIAISALALVAGTFAGGDFERRQTVGPEVAGATAPADESVASDGAEVIATRPEPPATGPPPAGEPPAPLDRLDEHEGSGADDDEGSGEAAPLADDDWAPLARADEGDTCRVRLNRSAVATQIHRREPRGTEGPFLANGEPIYVFLDVGNFTNVPQLLTLYWRQTETGYSFLQVAEAGAGSRWRTWTEQPLTLEQIGPWAILILDEDRCLVGELRFELQAAPW